MIGTRSAHTQTFSHANGPTLTTGAQVKPAGQADSTASLQSLSSTQVAVHIGGVELAIARQIRDSQSSAGDASTVSFGAVVPGSQTRPTCPPVS